MKPILKCSISCLLFFLLSCNKGDQYQTSEWIINNDAFLANDYSIGIGKAEAGFSSTGLKNRFALGFYLSYLPTSGNWPVYIDAGQNPSIAGLTFYYNGQFYIVSPFENAYLVAGEKNKKARYRLEPTWYVNYDNPEDSVLIQGTFKEPKI